MTDDMERMTCVYRVAYGGVFEALVETYGQRITRVIDVTTQLLGADVGALPQPRYYEAKMLVHSTRGNAT
jgi:hypothetical protein